MAIYAIGDVQGCFSELERLLRKFHFNPQQDQLWFAGDLVNRGPQSLETLHYVQSLGECAISVLGNHDIHLIACYTGAQNCKKDSSLNAILESSDADNLVEWLRHRPLLYNTPAIKHTILHAGLLPQWDLTAATGYAHEVENQLRSPHYIKFMDLIYGDVPAHWDERLTGIDRHRVIINAFTRLRFCDAQGRMNFSYKGPANQPPKGFRPWFAWPQRKSKNDSLIFGHWSALGLYTQHNVMGIDTGCLWGGELTAIRIDSDPVEVYSVNCTPKKKISPSGLTG